MDVCTQATCWNTEANDGTNPTTTEQNLRIRTEAANVYLQTRAHRRILELERSRRRKHTEFHLFELVYIWRVPKGKKKSGLGGTETGSGQLEFLRISDEMTDGLAELCGVFTTRVLYRAAPEHFRPATKRETFLHDVSAANLLPSEFEQVLQDGRVPDGAWTDLLDQGTPHAEAVETPEGNVLDDEGPGDNVPRKRIRVEAKTVKMEGLDNPDEKVFTIREDKDHESWRQFHRQKKVETSARTLASGKEMCEYPFLCLRMACFMQAWTPPRLSTQLAKGNN